MYSMATIITNFEPEKKSTIDEFIKSGKKLSLSHEGLLFKYQMTDDMILPMKGLISKYIDALSNYIISYEMTDDEYDRWRYNPKMVSRELYGTPELWSELLLINKMTSCVQFNKKTIKLFKTSIIDAINELLMLTKQDIKNNRAGINA